MQFSGKVSVVIPCLNEASSVGICVAEARYVFNEQRMDGEIIVVDNGCIDLSNFIASDNGARVVKQPLRGYGAAYLKGLSEAQGDYIVIADADTSYCLCNLADFIEPLTRGYDFVIGNRFGGSRLSMPWKSRYIGNPILSGMFRLLFKTKITDIHCGMRSFTKEAYLKMDLKSTGMEFASEMVASAIRNKLKICELPINYYPRIGKSKLNPIRDAIRHFYWMLKNV